MASSGPESDGDVKAAIRPGHRGEGGAVRGGDGLDDSEPEPEPEPVPVPVLVLGSGSMPVPMLGSGSGSMPELVAATTTCPLTVELLERLEQPADFLRRDYRAGIHD